MINHDLKTDARKLKLLIDGKLTFIVQHNPNGLIKVGEVLSYTDIADNRACPETFRCLAVHIETEHQVDGFAAIGVIDIDKLSESEFMSFGFSTPEQRASLRKDAWDGIGLVDKTESGLLEAKFWRGKVKHWTQSKPCPKQLEQIADYTNGLIEQFINENAAKEFLAKG